MASKLYNVEKIVEKKRINGKVLYFVKWEGYSEEDNTWEPASNLKHLKTMINDFNNKHETSSD